MKPRRQRKRPEWRQRLRNRCAYRAAIVRLIKVGTRRVASEREEERAGEAPTWIARSQHYHIPTCGECGADYPERPCGNPCNARDAHLIVCAWGVHGALRGRAARVMAELRADGRELHMLKLTRDGHPGHPLYLRSDLVPVPMSAENALAG